jgi:hypothetical protein
MDQLRSRELVLETNWMVRHPPGDDRIVLQVAWNAVGHALAATVRGLEYWDGTRWCSLPPDSLPPPNSGRIVQRLSAASWVVGGAQAKLYEYSRDGLRELFQGPDRDVTFTAITPGFDDIAVLLGQKAGAPPLLHALLGKRWLRPLPIPDAALISGLCRLEDERWLVVGRGSDGLPYAALYRPLDWQLERLQTPRARAMLACAGRPERRTATAVGTDGASLELEDGNLFVQHLPGNPDLSTIAMDTLGRQWAAGPGRVWTRRLSGEWAVVWQHNAWQPPFVSIMAEIGTVAAMTVDGAVLECRSVLLDKTSPAF